MEGIAEVSPGKCRGPIRPVREGEGAACRIPGGVIKIVAATCSDELSDHSVLFERLEAGLLAGLLAFPALVSVVRGTAYIPIVNVGTTDVLLYPRTVVCTLHTENVLSLPVGVTEEPPYTAHMPPQTVVSTLQDQIEAVDLSQLPNADQGRLRSLLREYTSVFAAHDVDLGCTKLISHDIPLVDHVPVKQRYRHIPSSDYEAIK